MFVAGLCSAGEEHRSDVCLQEAVQEALEEEAGGENGPAGEDDPGED